MAYRIYITDSLFYSAQNQRLTSRYIDMITPKKVDNRSETEVVNDIMSRAGLRFKK